MNMPSVQDSGEPNPGQKIIIIHPGSLYLRIGLASDATPFVTLNAIARRRRAGGGHYKDSALPPVIDKSKASLSEFEECRLQVLQTLNSCLQSDGQRRYATPISALSTFNRRSSPEAVQKPPFRYLDTRADFIVGDDVLSLDPAADYNVHFPIRRGELNVHSNIGGSIASVISDLQQIYESVLTCVLGVNLKELAAFKAVLVIPDIYNKSHLKELASLLLVKMGFGACFMIQDHVAATFGAGLGYACVVDIGDQKVSVSCVEDGISHPNTRVRLEFGGADITQTYFWLLKKCSFPYKECDDQLPRDAMLLHKLKQEHCHINLNICGPQERTFTVLPPNRPPLCYTIQTGDECIVAPLSLFHPELLCLTGRTKKAKIQSLQPDSEDCFDSEYLRETGRRGAKEQLEQTLADVSGTLNQDNQDEDLVVDTLEVERSQGQSKEFILPGGQMIGLDSAILQSIERCPNDEIKRKMYSCVLLVGASSKFEGIGKWLQNKVSMQTPYAFRPEQLEVITNAKDSDPAVTAWKGASIMSTLESAPELWVSRTEFQTHGLRVLREKSPFMW